MQEIIHQAKIVTVSLDQIGPGQNRCLAFSTFTVHPIHIYNDFNVIYSMHSGDSIHSFLRKQSFVRAYLFSRSAWSRMYLR